MSESDNEITVRFEVENAEEVSEAVREGKGSPKPLSESDSDALTGDVSESVSETARDAELSDEIAVDVAEAINERIEGGGFAPELVRNGADAISDEMEEKGDSDEAIDRVGDEIIRLLQGPKADELVEQNAEDEKTSDAVDALFETYVEEVESEELVDGILAGCVPRKARRGEADGGRVVWVSERYPAEA